MSTGTIWALIAVEFPLVISIVFLIFVIIPQMLWLPYNRTNHCSLIFVCWFIGCSFNPSNCSLDSSGSSVFQNAFFCFYWGKREKGGERNINVWLPLTCPQLGTQPATQACALTGNWTGNPSVCSPALNPLSHTSQGQIAFLFFCFLHFRDWSLVFGLWFDPEKVYFLLLWLFCRTSLWLSSKYKVVYGLSRCLIIPLFLKSRYCSLVPSAISLFL